MEVERGVRSLGQSKNPSTAGPSSNHSVHVFSGNDAQISFHTVIAPAVPLSSFISAVADGTRSIQGFAAFLSLTDSVSDGLYPPLLRQRSPPANRSSSALFLCSNYDGIFAFAPTLMPEGSSGRLRKLPHRLLINAQGLRIGEFAQNLSLPHRTKWLAGVKPQLPEREPSRQRSGRPGYQPLSGGSR